MTDAAPKTTTKQHTGRPIKCVLCDKETRNDHLGRHLCRADHVRQMTSEMTTDDFNSLQHHPLLFRRVDGRVVVAVCGCCEHTYRHDSDMSKERAHNEFCKFIKQHKQRGCFDPEKVKALREKQKKNLIKPVVIDEKAVAVLTNELAPTAAEEETTGAGTATEEAAATDTRDYDDLLARYEHNRQAAIEREAELETEIAELRAAMRGGGSMPKELVAAIHAQYDYKPDPDDDDDEEPTVFEKMASLIKSLKLSNRAVESRNFTIKEKNKRIAALEDMVLALGGNPYEDDE